MANHRKDMAAALRVSHRDVEREYKAANPDAEGLRVRSEVAVFKPRPIGMRGHAVRAADLMLSGSTYLGMSNAVLAAYLSREEPGYNAPGNLLTERYTAAEKTKVSVLLKRHGVALSMSKLDSPSKFKLALRAYRKGIAAEKTP